jgi:DNA polymerase-3 subunit beta
VKIKINRETFQKVFQLASAVAPARSPKPILQNVKLEVTSNGTILTATDMEVGVRLTVPDVEVEVPGVAVVSVSRLNMILRESTDEILRIDASPEKTLITGKSSRFELAAQNPDEFPEVADFQERDYIQIRSVVFKEMIRRTLFATDAESSRYALGGVLLEIDGDTMTAVGTDGRRLAKMEGAIELVGKPQIGGLTTIVPSRAMQLIERSLPDDETPIQLAARANDLLLKQPAGVFYTRLVEGRFPKWRDILPKRQQTNRIDIPVGPMYTALRQAAVVASEDSRGVDFTFKDNSLVLSNRTAEIGQSRIEMPVPFDTGELTITLDHRYVADFLRVLQPDKVFTFDIEDGEQAAYCETDDNYGYVIMPLSRERH